MTSPKQAALVALAGLALLWPTASGAQEPDGGRGEHRLVREITFVGNDAVPEDRLRAAVATRETRCRELLLRPFCWFSDWNVIVDRHYLDLDELPRDELRLRVQFFREGFREAAVRSAFREVSDGVDVDFRVEEGPPTLLGALEVHQVEPVLRSRDIRRARLPRVGEPFNLIRFEEALDSLADRLEELAYLDARVEDSIEIGPDGQARVEVVVDPGPRSVVGAIEIYGHVDLEEGTILRMLRIEEGDLLEGQPIRDSRRGLHESNLFLQADIVIPEQADSAKVVEIRVTEAPPRLGRLGGGFSTLEFVQLEGRFTHYNWFGDGRRFDIRGSVGNLLAPQLTGRLFFRDILPGALSGVDEAPFKRPTWQVSTELIQPHFRAAENVLGISLFAHRSIIPGISVDRGFGSDLSLTRRLAFRVPLTLQYRYEVTAVEAADVHFCVNFGICELAAIAPLRRHNALSPLTVTFVADRSDDPVAPTTGYRARLELEHASGATLSDYRYHRVAAQASYYESLGALRRHVVAGHVRAGWVNPLESTAGALEVEVPDADAPGRGIPDLDAHGAPARPPGILHPRKRFFAGGARSVRGYAENQLGPRVLTIPREALLAGGCTAEEIADASCDPGPAPLEAFQPRPTGGSSIAEASLEYRFPIGDFTGAVFVDGAVVGARPGPFLSNSTAAVTPGVGVRFASPAGPIRLDIGYLPRTAPRLRVITEVFDDEGLRQLVELDQRRRFDPLTEEGFFRRALSHLTLHFSIGEAF